MQVPLLSVVPSQSDVSRSAKSQLIRYTDAPLFPREKKMSLLPHIEIDPKSPADASIIWLHGLGADGHDFEPIVPELGLPTDAAVRFIFPHAPAIPVTINAGYVMPAWYDILISASIARSMWRS